ncbi:MAG TPA: zinc-ribbon domain-containing protein [Candidatus Limnocylindria bacterium]|nr:zinc-ribbon domain-containing protein [Candidatus Limnocylindria bacterium]
MILTCPRCAARYVVGEDQVGPQGRKVKCSACGEIWRAEAEIPEPPAPYIVVEPEPEPESVEAPATAPADDLRELVRARSRRSQSGRTMLWASVATLATVAVVAVVFRAELARVMGFQ